MSRIMAEIRVVLRSLIRRRRVEEELNAELQHHLELQIREELLKGASPAEARYAAMRAMGPTTKSMEECRDASRLTFIEDLLRDLKYAARTLRRNPGFAVVVLSTLAIAIGAVVTVFSIVDAWLLRPLNFPQPERLVISFAAQPSRPTEPSVFLPYRAYVGWKERSRSFESVAAAFPHNATLTTAADAQTVMGLNVTPEFFQTFGVEALLGRAFLSENVAAARNVVLSYGLWQRHWICVSISGRP
jgi:hypothetical protein